MTAVLAAGLLAASPASAAESVPFAADSGDTCRRGVAEGTLERYDGPVLHPAVNVEGILSDEALPTICFPDDMHSTVTFSGYRGADLLDSETYKADDEQVKFAFELSNGLLSIDRVVVQVCRFSNSPVGISYCGKAQEYKIP
ncbi:hypothetical protein HCN51_35520 [Nonomuraea sp. FMUSA5-5]|uniref:Secreted protein n=1 Tax=Nonomuraea composti TaxID=2720023 RepID=A0ABX1BA69_9ACTN|nr:hypothetical protein [Nonomuraea sp. FMUSA5-5]NJP94690.1 hypothetical protein [Nonomuraea sp. FMUSA5-5]